MTTLLHITRYSLVARELLQRHAPVVGDIHSCYGRIVNIQTPENRLLTLQGPGLMQSPSAVSVRESLENMIDWFSPGDAVAQDDQSPARFQLLADVAAVWDGRLTPVPSLTAARCQAVSQTLSGWLQHHAADKGLTPLLTALDTRHTDILSPLLRRLYLPLVNLVTQPHLTADSFLELAMQVVGLGDGLTPSGDDLVVGLIAALHVANQATAILDPRTVGVLIDHCARHTTDLSTEFVRCAIEGHFSEPLVCLMRSLYGPGPSDWVDHADRLAHVGHSSGVDAMIGIVLGSYLSAADLPH